MREGGVDAVHVTITYHESFREMVLQLEAWNRRFEKFPDLIMRATMAEDVVTAHATDRTAIFFGFQNPSPIEDDIGLIEIVHQLGVRFMQLTYNNQSLLASGCYEADDTGLTRFGVQAVAEMNRVGLVVDMSHSGDRSTLEAIDASSRPIAITHANPSWWHPARRNFGDNVIKPLVARGGMVGFSVYPHHLKGGSECTIKSFCQMVAEAASRYGAECLGIGTDLCQDQPNSIVEWMRVGRWSKAMDYGEGSVDAAGFPAMPSWFGDNRDFYKIRAGLVAVGMSEVEIDGIMGNNWYNFYCRNFDFAKS
jgi:membrane dipeptidase